MTYEHMLKKNKKIEQKIKQIQTKLKKLPEGQCKCQYKNVGFIQNNYVEKPTFLFCIFSLLSSVKCCI